MDCEFKHLLAPQGQDDVVEEIVAIFSNSKYNLVRVSMKGNKKPQIHTNYNMSSINIYFK